MDKLPVLDLAKLASTRDYLRDVALVLGSLQRAFLPEHPREWQHGLEVVMRGISTQPFTMAGEETRALLDLVKKKIRLGETNWSLYEHDGSEIFNNVKVWLEAKGIQAELEKPEFSNGSEFDGVQTKAYAEALWWLDKQMRVIKASLSEGVTSSVLLYPHHFDLSLSWFPQDDEKQMNFGWSTGDESIPEPYIYLTAYPEPKGFIDIKLPEGAYWQKEGFSGAILPYAVLQTSDKPEELLQKFALETFTAGRKLFT